jgi:hypothetical protein
MGGALGADDDDDALVAGLVPGVLLDAHVLLRHAVDEGPLRVRVDALDRAADLQVAVGVRGIDDRQRDARLALDVAELLATGGLAEAQQLAVPAEPDVVVYAIASP